MLRLRPSDICKLRMNIIGGNGSAWVCPYEHLLSHYASPPSLCCGPTGQCANGRCQCCENLHEDEVMHCCFHRSLSVGRWMSPLALTTSPASGRRKVPPAGVALSRNITTKIFVGCKHTWSSIRSLNHNIAHRTVRGTDCEDAAGSSGMSSAPSLPRASQTNCR